MEKEIGKTWDRETKNLVLLFGHLFSGTDEITANGDTNSGLYLEPFVSL